LNKYGNLLGIYSIIHARRCEACAVFFLLTSYTNRQYGGRRIECWWFDFPAIGG